MIAWYAPQKGVLSMCPDVNSRKQGYPYKICQILPIIPDICTIFTKPRGVLRRNGNMIISDRPHACVTPATNEARGRAAYFSPTHI